MFSTKYTHKIVLLTSSFQYPLRRLLFARARLFLDRIELTGWHFGDKYQEQIPLDQISWIEWKLDAVHGPNVIFHLEDDTQFPLILKQAYLWKHTLEERLQWNAPAHFRLSSAVTKPELPLKDIIAFSSGMG